MASLLAEDCDGGDDSALRSFASRTDTELMVEDLAQRGGEAPIAFLHMIYRQLGSNKTLVDQEVDFLRHQKKLKVLHLPGDAAGVKGRGTLIALVLTSNYLQAVDEAAAKAPQQNRRALDHFKRWVQESDQISFSAEEVRGCLQGSDLDELEALAFLRRRQDVIVQTAATAAATATAAPLTVYWLSHPALGGIVSTLRRVERAVSTALARSRYKELSASAFYNLFPHYPPSSSSSLTSTGPPNKKRKKSGLHVTDLFTSSPLPSAAAGLSLSSSFDPSFHLLDLLGRGLFKKVDRPDGSFLLRLP
eukprot:gene3586-3927_t